MYKMRKALITMLAGASLALATLHSSEISQNYVREGRIKHREGYMFSNDFCHCSAVILDSRNEALFAHAKPGSEPDAWESLETVCVGNVVDKMVAEARTRGFDLQKSFAIVNAASKNSQYRISADFENYGVEVRYTSTVFAPEGRDFRARMVSYDPKTNSLEIRRGLFRETFDLDRLR